MSEQNVQKGRIGEARAEAYLKKIGYKILKTNYRCSSGEIDIIALDGKTLVFLEVKSRANTAYGSPSEAVNYKKQQHIAKAAVTYIKQNNLFDMPARFDVIEIIDDDIRLIKNAFLSDVWY
ncbi:MAG TPA: YraN family protein [Clostridia bacterium]